MQVLWLLIFTSPSLIAGGSITQVREVLDTIAALIRSGNYEAVIRMGSSPQFSQILGQGIQTVAMEINGREILSSASDDHFRRFLYGQGWFTRPYASRLLEQTEQHDVIIAGFPNFIRIPTFPVTLHQGQYLDSTQAFHLPANRIHEIHRFLSLVIFEEIFHYLDVMVLNTSGNSESSVMNRILRRLSLDYQTEVQANGREAFELAAFAAMAYEYELLPEGPIRELFVQYHQERRVFTGKWKQLASTAVNQLRTAGNLPNPQVSQRIITQLEIDRPEWTSPPPTHSLRSGACQNLSLIDRLRISFTGGVP